MKKNKRLIDFLPPEVEGLSQELTSEDFEYLQQLGTGSFASVSKIRHKQTRKIYALKAIKKYTIVQSRKVDQVMLELKIMYQINHQNILRLYSHFEDDDNVNLLLDYLPGGSLYDKLIQSSYLREQDAVIYMRQIVSAIAYLHEQPEAIIHRDIKPENILLDEEGQIKLADFGSANSVSQDNKFRYTYTGSLVYMAPEIIEKQGYDQTVDIWSLGVLIYELLAGDTPFLPMIDRKTMGEKKQELTLEENIKSVNITFPDDFPPLARDLVRKMLKKEPSQRITLREVLEHPWLKQHINQSFSQRESVTKQSLIAQSIRKLKTSKTSDQEAKQKIINQLKQSIMDVKNKINECSIQIHKTELENEDLRSKILESEKQNDQLNDIQQLDSMETNDVPKNLAQAQDEFNQLHEKILLRQAEIILKERQIAQNQIEIDKLSILDDKVKREKKTVEKLEEQLLELDETKSIQSNKLEQIFQYFTHLNNENNQLSDKNQDVTEEKNKFLLKQVISKFKELILLHKEQIFNPSSAEYENSDEENSQNDEILEDFSPDIIDKKLSETRKQLKFQFEEKKRQMNESIKQKMKVLKELELKNSQICQEAQAVMRNEESIEKLENVVSKLVFSHTIKSENVRNLREQKEKKEKTLYQLQNDMISNRLQHQHLP